MTTLTPRLQTAAMLLQGLYANPKIIDDHHHARNFALQEADALLAECGEGEANGCEYCERTLRQEERATEWADKLANEIASKLHVDIGEHSSSNCPWENALEAIEDYEPTQPRKIEVTEADGTKVCADALIAELGEDKPTNEHQNYSALPKSPYARPHVSGSVTTPTSKVEVTDEMVKRFAENYIGAGHTEPTLRGALNYIINGDDA